MAEQEETIEELEMEVKHQFQLQQSRISEASARVEAAQAMLALSKGQLSTAVDALRMRYWKEGKVVTNLDVDKGTITMINEAPPVETKVED